MYRALVVCALALTAVASAEPPSRYQFRSYGSEQGLHNLSINQISQTADGLLWVATEDGLYSYDGVRFQRLDLPASLPSSQIYALLPGAHQLWVGTAEGLAVVEHGQLRSLGAPSGLPADQINALATAPDGTLWVATDVGLFHQTMGDQFALAPGWTGPSAAVWVGRDGHVVAGRGANLTVFDGTAGWREYGASAGFDRDRIEAIAETGDGTLWVRSAHSLWSCGHDLAACVDRSSELPDVSEVGRLLVDRRGTLWVTTRQGLAHRLDSTKWELVDSGQGLGARSVINAFEDREGSIWLAADQLYQQLGRQLWRSYSSQSALPADTVWTAIRDHRGSMWLGTNRGVVEAVGDTWRTFPGTEPFTIYTIVEANGLIYAAGNEGSIMRLDPTTSVMTTVGDGSRLVDDGIVSMVHDHGSFYLATDNAGLLRVTETASGSRSERVELPDGSEREDIGQLILDREGRMWAAGSAGLAVLDHGRWRRFTHHDGLAATPTAYLVERASGEICVAYSESLGVSCFRYTGGLTPRLEAMHHLTHASGLTSDKIYMLGEDRAGRLYAGMGIGVDVIDHRGIEHFSSANGLDGDDCAARAFWGEPTGDVLIGTTRGLARFAVGRYAGPPAPTMPVVRSIALGGVVATTGEAPHAPISGTTSLVVSFAVPSFAGGELERQVRLLPLENEWRTTRFDEARYAQLPPGEYVLELRVRLAPGPYGAVVRVPVTVLPAWWQTTWFRVLVAVLLLLLAITVVAFGARVMTRRAAERILQRSQASFRALIEQSPDLVFVLQNRTVVYANEKTVACLGYADEQDIVGRSAFALLAPDEHEVALKRMQALTSTGEPAPPREMRMMRKDGSMVFVEISALQLEFQGAPSIVVIARDCTERKSLEARLMSADRMASIGTLAAGIAHEVNNPLAYVKSNLATIAEELEHSPANETVRTAVADALEGATRVETIVRGLRTFSRLERDLRQPVNLHRALELALRMTANDHRNRCKIIEGYGPVPSVLGDEAKLGQVFINLLVNAAHAIPEGHPEDHSITIVTRTDASGRAVVEIQDTGRGMSPEVQKRIFEPFFTTKDVGQGTGLGLSICHGIVQSLGGQLTVESTPGLGSTFRVILAGTTEVDSEESITPIAGEPAPACPIHRVLIIDDDARLLASIGRRLKKHLDVTLVSCADEALAKLDEGLRFDVILSDLMMPGYTGMDLHAWLAERMPDQARRMLFMTGGAFTVAAQLFLEGDSIPWIEKPFELAELLRRIQEVAQRANTNPGAVVVSAQASADPRSSAMRT